MAPHVTRSIDVFRPGTFTPMVGNPITFSADDLRAMAGAYDPEAPAPAVVGHPRTDAPAYGWAKAFSFDEGRQRLVAELGEVDPAFADAVKAGRYKKISLELFSPTAPNNPKPGAWYPKHIGFLGAAAPAVSGLKNVAFAEGGEGVVTIEQGDAAFSDAAFRDVAGLFRSLREFLIEKFGSDTADKALPNWTIGWIEEAGDEDDNNMPGFAGSQFAEPTKKEPAMAGQTTDAAHQQRLAELEAREQALAAREKQAHHQANVSFCEALVADAKLLPVLKDKTVALLDGLLAVEAQTVSFAEGGATVTRSPHELVSEILSAMPPIVSFGDISGTHDEAGAGTVSFAMPEGMQADSSSMALHRKAEAYQRAHPGTDYMTAVAAVQS